MNPADEAGSFGWDYKALRREGRWAGSNKNRLGLSGTPRRSIFANEEKIVAWLRSGGGVGEKKKAGPGQGTGRSYSGGERCGLPLLPAGMTAPRTFRRVTPFNAGLSSVRASSTRCRSHSDGTSIKHRLI